MTSANTERADQVFKFSPDGKVLMTLGKAGVPGNGPETFNRPSAVVVAPNGDIFVADGHNFSPGFADELARREVFERRKIHQGMGQAGNGSRRIQRAARSRPSIPSGAFSVADRSNNRIQIFDQDGNFQQEWKQFGRPSGIFIDRDDTM